MSDDEQTASAILNVAVVATQLITVSEALALQYGEQTVRNALLVAFATIGERALGEQGMREELHETVARLLESPAIADAVSKWLH